jgi:hypothetical protein
MFNTTLLHEIIAKKTHYDVIIGGSTLPADFEKGCVIINLINSTPLTQSFKDFSSIQTKDNTSTIKSTNLVRNNYQLDLYRINPRNFEYLDIEVQAQRLREYLNSYDVADYMEKIGADILPVTSQITFLSEFNEQKKLINRAFFEIAVVFTIQGEQNINIFDKITLENKLIGG